MPGCAPLSGASRKIPAFAGRREHHAFGHAELHLARLEVRDHQRHAPEQLLGRVRGPDAGEHRALALAEVERELQQLVGAFDGFGGDDLRDAQVELREVVDRDVSAALRHSSPARPQAPSGRQWRRAAPPSRRPRAARRSASGRCGPSGAVPRRCAPERRAGRPHHSARSSPKSRARRARRCRQDRRQEHGKRLEAARCSRSPRDGARRASPGPWRAAHGCSRRSSVDLVGSPSILRSAPNWRS